MSHFVAYILQFQEIIVYKIPPGGRRGSIASLRSICFTLLRNAAQHLILILAHKNAMPGVTLKQTRISSPLPERRTAACSGYQGTHTDTGKSPLRTKYRNNLRQTKHVFL